MKPKFQWKVKSFWRVGSVIAISKNLMEMHGVRIKATSVGGAKVGTPRWGFDV